MPRTLHIYCLAPFFTSLGATPAPNRSRPDLSRRDPGRPLCRGDCRGGPGTGAGSSAPAPSPHTSLAVVVGDHPEPGAGSLAAATALADRASAAASGAEVWVLLSGGTTSLLGAPVDGISPADLSRIYALLLGSGLDIIAMNRIRKRFSRWGGGRLARALAPAPVRVYVVSDVIGDD